MKDEGGGFFGNLMNNALLKMVEVRHPSTCSGRHTAPRIAI
jgi:hypothetical protein